MVDGPIFGSSPVGSPVEACRDTKGGKGKGWDLPCVLKILCNKDADVVKHLNKDVKLYKVDRVYFDDNYFDGKKWIVKRFEAGGTQGQDSITFLSKDDCERAATVLYHETWHSKQPDSMGWPHPKEDDAYYNTELWTISNNFPSQGADIRVKDAKGNVVPDKAAIKQLVDNVYPVPPPAPPGWSIENFDKAKKRTQWYDENTKKFAWKASKVGDTVSGPQKTEGKQQIPNGSIKCP